MNTKSKWSYTQPTAPGTKPKKIKRPRRSIKLDAVNPRDFQNLNLIYCCEQCSHFDSMGKLCTIGFNAQHTQERQLSLYYLTGKMAFCRFTEID